MTVLVVGTSIHALYAVLPLSLSFALIAIVAPTDASAVNSIFEANPIAEEQAETLQHESLFNDAAGIVIFDMALAAYMSGQFSIEAAVGMFAWEFLGGLLFGAIIGVIVVSTRLFLIRHNDDTPFDYGIDSVINAIFGLFAGGKIGIVRHFGSCRCWFGSRIRTG